MKRLHIVGKRNHGKTSLIIELCRALRARRIEVGTIKHTRHFHELDVPGKDSFLHRRAGANPAAVISKGAAAVFVEARGGEGDYRRLEPLFNGCRVVLVEGHVGSGAPKVEVWRAEPGNQPLACDHEGILALVSDDRPPLEIEVWPRSDIEYIADRVLDVLE